MYPDYYTEDDVRLCSMLPRISLTRGLQEKQPELRENRTEIVCSPDEEYAFLHEAAIIEFHGVLYASWYNCPNLELQGETPIRGRRSKDGGKTWSPVEVIAQDLSGRILYCPPVYGICEGRLYMLVNQMVSADHMHSLDLYVLNEQTDRFECLWSRPIPFKLNTNVLKLANGKLMLPGRIAELDGFPNTPAVLISDSGKIDADWRLVKIQPDGRLPDGSRLIHPEISAAMSGEKIWMFCRDDERHVPLVYFSEDCGETWVGPYAHDIPLSNSKIYTGELRDGRHYLIGNLYPGRGRLAVYLTPPGEMTFTEAFLIQDGEAHLPNAVRWHYPSACEADEKLYVIYTVSFTDKRRGAVLSAIPLCT